MADANPDRLPDPGRAFTPVDIAGIAVFRIAFGLAALAQVWLVVRDDGIARYWTDPPFHFTYPGLGWLHPWPGAGMTIQFTVMAVAAACISLGFLYRLSVVVWGLGWTHALFCDQALYQNHFYLLCLLSLIMLFVPAHRAWSLDARLGLATPSATAPAWSL
ncbi:MAG: HTTM domain-containing protein, partial [Planctomycetota bacterium]